MEYKTVRERLQHIEHAIFGNGSIGMVEQIQEIRKEVKALKKILVVLAGLLVLTLGEKIISILIKFL